MHPIKGKTALITGASSGIGMELAKIHAQQGGNLVLVARRLERLEQLKTELEQKHQVSVFVIQKDLSHPSAAQEIYDEVKAKNIDVEFLVNNAGFGGLGKFHEREWAQDEAMIQVNITALAALTRFFLDDMVAKNSGRILNVASTAGFLPGPLQAVYYASKAFVVSFSEALANELSDTNVTVTALCPTATETEFAEKSDLEETNLFTQKLATAYDVAMDGYRAMQKGKTIVFNDPKMGFLLRRVIPVLPRKLVLKTSRKYMEQN